MKHTPTANRIFVLQDPIEKITKGGIEIPQETAEAERPLAGEVVAVGPDVKWLVPKQRVLFTAYAGQKLHIEGEDLLVMAEDGILAVANA